MPSYALLLPLTLAVLAAAGEIAPEPVQRSAWELFAIGLGAAAAFVACLGALWWLVKPRLEQWARRELVAPLNKVHHQVTVNGGKSHPPTLLDEVGRNASAVESLRDDFNTHVAAATRDSEAMWRAIEAVAKAQPPEGDEG